MAARAQAAEFWTVPRVWEGRTVYVVAGGPSLTGFDLGPLRGRRVVVVNNAYQIVPHAQYLYFHDRRWGEWHHEGVLDFAKRGGRVVTSSVPFHALKKTVLRLRRECRPHPALSDDQNLVNGPDSGGQAVNMVYLLGASTIVLLGFDMGFDKPDKNGDDPVSHWHPPHPVVSRESNYKSRFRPAHEARITTLRERGVRVLSATPTALSVPVVPLRDITGTEGRDGYRAHPTEGPTALPV